MADLASILIVTYNHRKYLEKCLKSILTQNYPHEIIVIDNCSSDGTPEYIEKNFPEVRVIKSDVNRGYGAGNNLGVRYSKGKYVVILNPDVIVDTAWLKNLIQPLENNDRIITTPKILVYDGSFINTCGNSNHFTGLTLTNGYGRHPSEYNEIKVESGISGACFAITRGHFIDLGGFDENFFVYNEDSDFSWRALLNDYRILSIPNSVIYHDYHLNISPEKIYHLERGRYFIVRKYFLKSDLLLLSPSLFLAEVLSFPYVLKFGWKGLKLKFLAIAEGLSIPFMKIRGDKRNLQTNLKTTLSADQLLFHKTEKIGLNFVNIIFKLNFRIFLFLAKKS